VYVDPHTTTLNAINHWRIHDQIQLHLRPAF